MTMSQATARVALREDTYLALVEFLRWLIRSDAFERRFESATLGLDLGSLQANEAKESVIGVLREGGVNATGKNRKQS